MNGNGRSSIIITTMAVIRPFGLRVETSVCVPVHLGLRAGTSGSETLAESSMYWPAGFMEDSMAGENSPNGSGPDQGSGSFRSSGISS